MTRRIVVLCCFALLVGVACERPVSGRTAPAGGADDFPVSVAEVRVISGMEEFSRVRDDDEAMPDYVTPDGPCRALFDPGAAFGADWTAFRTVADEADLDTGGPAPLIASVGQTVVVYPNSDAARQSHASRSAELTACSQLDLPYLGGTVSQRDPDTTVYDNEGWTLVSTIEAAVVVDVWVGALADADRVATEISDAIAGRIVCPDGAKRGQLC